MPTENDLPTIKNLICSTCTHHKIVGRIPNIDECDIMDHTPTESDKKFIRQMGCASHSCALQVLAKPVVEELETKKRNCDDIKYELPVLSESYGQLKIASHALGTAIKLLKGDN